MFNFGSFLVQSKRRQRQTLFLFIKKYVSVEETEFTLVSS